MAFPRSYLAKRMEFGRARCSEKLVPGIRSECHDTRQSSVYPTEINRAENSRKVSAERPHGCVALTVRLNTDNQEYCCTSERRKHVLRKRGRGHAHLMFALLLLMQGNAQGQRSRRLTV